MIAVTGPIARVLVALGMNPDDPSQVDAAFAAHKREQARRALAMTPSERDGDLT